MVKKTIKNSLVQKNLRGDVSIPTEHPEIPPHIWSTISKYNQYVSSFASFLRGDDVEAEGYPTIGEADYRELHNLAVKNGWIKGEMLELVKPETGKRMSNREKIIQENNRRVFQSKIDLFLKNEENVRFKSSLEFRVIGFIRYAQKVLKGKNEREKYAIAISLLKLPIEETEMLPQLRLDLENFIDYYVETMRFDWRVAFANYPDFLSAPPYLDILPLQPIFKLRPNQIRTTELLTSEEPVIIINRASVGSGKTANVAKTALEFHQRSIKKTLVFCCASSAVRMNVAQLAVATGVPFAFYQNERFTYPPSIAQGLRMGEKQFVNLVIVNYSDVRNLLSRELGNFVLILDEPTIGADRPNDPRTHLMVDLLFGYATPQTVIISGTLPPYSEFKEFYDQIQSYPGSRIIELTDSGSALGCDMIRPNNTYYEPENQCITKEDLDQILSSLKANPLLTRFHNYRHLLELMNRVDENDEIEEVPDLDDFFLNSKHWNHLAVSRAIVEVLEDLPDEVVEDICRPEEVPVERILQRERIFQTQAHRLFGGCLVVSSDPLQRAIGFANPLVKGYGVERMRKDSDSDSEIDEQEITDPLEYGWAMLGVEALKAPRVQRDLRVAQERVQMTEEDEERGKTSKSFRHGKMEEGEVDFEVIWGFPKSLQINSPEHQAIYARGARLNRDDYVPLIGYDDLPTSGAIGRELLILLAMGVGIYDEKLPSSYLDSVISLAGLGKLSFIFSNLDISYGVTIPLNRLIIDDDDIILSASTATLIQLLGRIGRLGRTAIIYTFSNLIEEKFNRVLRGIPDLTEKENILKAF